jgi:hypothetical protein
MASSCSIPRPTRRDKLLSVCLIQVKASSALPSKMHSTLISLTSTINFGNPPLTPIKDTMRFLPEDRGMTEVVIGIGKAVGIIPDSALGVADQCPDRGQQLMKCDEVDRCGVEPLFGRVAWERAPIVPRLRERRGDEEAKSCPTC